jgi:hypothetical protein
MNPGTRIIVHNTGFKNLDGETGKVMRIGADGRVMVMIRGVVEWLERRQVRRRWWCFW